VFTFQTYDNVKPGDLVTLVDGGIRFLFGATARLKIEFKIKNSDGSDQLISLFSAPILRRQMLLPEAIQTVYRKWNSPAGQEELFCH